MELDSDLLHGGLERFLLRASTVSGMPAHEIAGHLGLPATMITLDSNKDLRRFVDPDSVILVAEGLVLQYCLFNGDERQGVGLFVPGDIANLSAALGAETGGTFYAYAGAVLSIVKRGDFLQALHRQPGLLRVVSREMAVATSHMQDLLVNIGGRHAGPRIAHFCLWLAARMKAAGLECDGSYDMPLTQQHMSELLGLSLVHTNKSCRSLERAGAIVIEKRRLTILNWDRLRSCANATTLDI